MRHDNTIGLEQFKERIHHEHSLELERLRGEFSLSQEKLKNDLTISAHITQELTERRLSLYPKAVELVYRTRNLAREICTSLPISQIVADELAARTRELDENLYTCRLDFERDSIFLPLHTYKNTVKTFSRLISDYMFHHGRGDLGNAEVVANDLKSLYGEVEAQHKPVIDRLSGYSEPQPHILQHS